MVHEIDYGVSPGRPKRLRGTNAERLAYNTTGLAIGTTFTTIDESTKKWICENTPKQKLA